jgi:hypothetical protein
VQGVILGMCVDTDDQPVECDGIDKSVHILARFTGVGPAQLDNVIDAGTTFVLVFVRGQDGESLKDIFLMDTPYSASVRRQVAHTHGENAQGKVVSRAVDIVCIGDGEVAHKGKSSRLYRPRDGGASTIQVEAAAAARGVRCCAKNCNRWPARQGAPCRLGA